MVAILALAAIATVVGAAAWWVVGDPDTSSAAPASPIAPEITRDTESRPAVGPRSAPELAEPEANPVEALAPPEENNLARGHYSILGAWSLERTGRDRAPCTLVVIDWEDRPVAGALVHVVGDEYQRRSGGDYPVERPPTIGPFEFVTDADGRSMVQLPEHSPRALVEKPGVGQSSWVPLAPRDRHEWREILVPLRPPATLTGCVVQADGAPAPGAGVRVCTLGGGSVVDVELTTDAGGRFETAVPSLESIGVRVEVPDQSTRWHQSRLQPGETREVRLRLPGDYAIRGQVVDADGQPYSGEHELWVSFWPDSELASDAEGFGGSGHSSAVRVEDEGRFELVLDRPIRGMLTASGDIPGLIEVPTVAIDAGHPRADVVLHVVDAATIRGRVLDEAGSPLSGVVMKASPVKAERATSKGPSSAQLFASDQATTTNTGEFVLEGLHPQGVYTIRAQDRKEGRILVAKDVAAGTTDLVLACGSAAERSGSITLVVMAGDTGGRAARCRVQVCDSSSHETVAGEESDDGSGLIAVDRLEAGAAYDLIVSAKDLACQYIGGVVATAEGAAVKLTLSVPTTLSIEARRDGLPAPWPVVSAQRDASAQEKRVHRHVPYMARGSESGLVEWQDLDPGRYSLIVSQGGRRATAEVELAPGESRRIVVELD